MQAVAAPVAAGGRLWKLIVPAAVIVVALVAGGLYWRSRSTASAPSTAPLSEKDTVVLADFDNKTGDAVFDDALKQALAVQLGQSPFINILSDRRVNGTLGLMGKPSGTRISPEIARELCTPDGQQGDRTGFHFESGRPICGRDWTRWGAAPAISWRRSRKRLPESRTC